MSINLSYYDITQIDYREDTTNNGAIPQSGAWIPLVAGFQSFNWKKAENRLQHRGNSQSLTIDKSVKNWAEWELGLVVLKYEASPLFDWWNFIHLAFYGGATGAPVIRPGNVWLAAKYNRATPEYFTAFGSKIEEITIRGNMTQDAMTILMRGMSRGFSFNTTNYVQGTATRQADPTKNPIVPASDVTIKIDNVDETQNIQDWTLTFRRTYRKSGLSATAAGSSSQIATDGKFFREFTPETIDARFNINIDPVGTASDRLIDHINDAALLTCELQAENATNGKQIQFTASKTTQADQNHAEGQSPSTIPLEIVASTINVNTL